MLEKIVLIFALFGSAKVALDMITAAFTKKDAASSGHTVKEVQTNEELNRIVILLEEMSKKNEALQLRLAAVEAEHSAATTQQKTAKQIQRLTARSGQHQLLHRCGKPFPGETSQQQMP